MRYFVSVILYFWATCVLGQEVLDFGQAAHWTGGFDLHSSLENQTLLILDNVVHLVDAEGVVRRVDISDPYAPRELEPVTYIAPARRLLGPFEGRIYVATDPLLISTTGPDLEFAGYLPYLDVIAMAQEGDLGAMICDGGETLVVFDSTEPDALPPLGTIENPEFWSHWSHLEFWGGLLLLSTDFPFTKAEIVDLEYPFWPRSVGQFGWRSYGVPETPGIKTITDNRNTIMAFGADQAYALETYSWGDSATMRSEHHCYLSRWDIQDPGNPELLVRGLLLDSTRLSRHCVRRGNELLVIADGRILSVDIEDPELDDITFLAGVADDPPVAFAADGDQMVMAEPMGRIHLFRDRQPGGPAPLATGAENYQSSALGDDRFMVARLGYDTSEGRFTLEVDAFDTSDPEMPVPLVNASEHLSSYFMPFSVFAGSARIAPHCAVTWSTGLYTNLFSVDLVTGQGSFLPTQVRDFEFLPGTLALATGEDGLRLLDTANPASFQQIQLVDVEPMGQLGTVAGDMEWMAALLLDSGQVKIFDFSIPSEPSFLSRLDVSWDGLVRVAGGDISLLVGIREGREQWSGYCLELVVLGETGEPESQGWCPLPGYPSAGALEGAALHLACGRAGMVVVDVGDPANPFIRGGVATDPVHDIQLEDGRLHLATDEFVLLEPDVATPVLDPVRNLFLQEEDGEVRIRWDAAPGFQALDFRLRVESEDGESRTLAVSPEGSGWVATDDQPGTGRLEYVVEYRLEGSSPFWKMGASSALIRTLPDSPSISGVAPNPFNPAVMLTCQVPAAGHLRVGVFDLAGRRVQVLIDQWCPGGERSLVWDGLDVSGHAMPSGTYFVRLESESGVSSRKIQLVR